MTSEELRQTAEAIVQVASTGSPEAQQYAKEHAIALLNPSVRKDLLSMWPIGTKHNVYDIYLDTCRLFYERKHLIGSKRLATHSLM